jgi:hypothetical protein
LVEVAVHGLIATLLTAMRLLEAGGLSVLGRDTAPAYWLKSGRPMEVEIAARATRFSRS